MRLTTLLLVLSMMMVGVALYANGSAPAAPQEQPAQPEVSPPAGAGPEEQPPAVEEAPAEEQPPAMEQPSEEAIPPAGAGPTAPAAPPMTGGMMQPMTPEVETFNTNFITMNFGVDRSSIMGLRHAGWMWGDIYLMAHISKSANRPILEVAALRSQGMSWTDIASRYNISTVALTTPSMVQTRVAGFVTEYGYQPLYYRTDPWGNPVLTRFDAERMSRLGYSWQNIAVAANVAAETGASVRDVLSWTDRGYTWQQVAREYGLDPDDIMNVSQYPFARESGAMMTTPTTIPTMPPSGAGPMQPMPMPPMTTPPMQPGTAPTPTY